MPSPERALLDACAAAMREERERWSIWHDSAHGWPHHGVWRRTPSPEPETIWPTPAPPHHLGAKAEYSGSYEDCRAYIDRRAFAAGLRMLAESEPTEAMRKAWSDVDMLYWNRITREWRAMLGALLAGGDDA